jgi:hypothetical protein
MSYFTMLGSNPRPPPERRKTNILSRIRDLRLREIEHDEDRSQEAMLHWRDPVERLRTLRRRNHTLVDDNPASG